jgi:hypothetical protein
MEQALTFLQAFVPKTDIQEFGGLMFQVGQVVVVLVVVGILVYHWRKRKHK